MNSEMTVFAWQTVIVLIDALKVVAVALTGIGLCIAVLILVVPKAGDFQFGGHDRHRDLFLPAEDTSATQDVVVIGKVAPENAPESRPTKPEPECNTPRPAMG